MNPISAVSVPLAGLPDSKKHSRSIQFLMNGCVILSSMIYACKRPPCFAQRRASIDTTRFHPGRNCAKSMHAPRSRAS